MLYFFQTLLCPFKNQIDPIFSLHLPAAGVMLHYNTLGRFKFRPFSSLPLHYFSLCQSSNLYTTVTPLHLVQAGGFCILITWKLGTFQKPYLSAQQQQKSDKKKWRRNLLYQWKRGKQCWSDCFLGAWTQVQRWRTWVHVSDTRIDWGIGLQAAPTLPLPALPSCVSFHVPPSQGFNFQFNNPLNRLLLLKRHEVMEVATQWTHNKRLKNRKNIIWYWPWVSWKLQSLVGLCWGFILFIGLFGGELNSLWVPKGTRH